VTLRIRCEVLRAIAICNGATSETVHEMLPDFEPKQIQKTTYQFLTQDRIFKNRKKERSGATGRPRFIYIANANWEPAQKNKEVKKTGRKSHSESLKTDGGESMPIVRFRDRKVRLLSSLINKVSGSDRDFPIGLPTLFGFFRYQHH